MTKAGAGPGALVQRMNQDTRVWANDPGMLAAHGFTPGQTGGNLDCILLTVEERRAQAATIDDDVLAGLVSEFGGIIDAADDIAGLDNTVADYGGQLWCHARERIQAGTYDDNSIYIARLQMRAYLKQTDNSLLQQNCAEIQSLIDTLEQSSRGFTDVPPAGEQGTGAQQGGGGDAQSDGDQTAGTAPEEKTAQEGGGDTQSAPGRDAQASGTILLSGFDPFGGADTNPSGLVAMYFDGKSLVRNDRKYVIEAVVFPVRYDDFDEGIVEDFFAPYIDEVDAIITVSQTSFSKNIDIDRFSGNIRSGNGDNNDDTRASGAILPDGDNFYETTLPVEAMMEGELDREEEQRYYYRQLWETENAHDWRYRYPNRDDAYNCDQDLFPASDLENQGTPRYGSSGDYLSNEIHYRVAHLRNENRPELPTGHLHITNVADKDRFMADFEELLNRIADALPAG